MSESSKTSAAFPAIIIGGLVVGTLDISSAIIIWLSRGIGITRGFQGIASGLLGARSYEGGLPTVLFGLAIHFFIAFVVVTIFYVASREIPLLTRQALVSGVLYGIAVYLLMYWFVLPTTFPTFHHKFGNDALAIAIHICLIGLPTALIVRRSSQPQ